MTQVVPLASSCHFYRARQMFGIVRRPHDAGSLLGKRIVAVFIAAILSGVVPVGQVAIAAPDVSRTSTASAFAEGSVEADIDSFWRQIFAIDAQDYWTPDVVPVSAAVDSGCGYVTPDQYLAFYCSVDLAVYWSIPGYEEAFAQSGDAAWINIMAHEWSHHVQLLLGINTPWRQANDSVGLELEATCMGGAYVADAQDRGLVDEDMIASMVGMFGGSEMHGSTEQVRSAFWNGLENGIMACGVAL